MKAIKYSIGIIVSLIFLLTSCSDSLKNTKKDATVVSLFGEVTESEETTTGYGGSEKMFLSDMASSGGSGWTGSTGSWGSGEPDGNIDQGDAGVLTAGEWSDLNNWQFWNDLLGNQEYHDDVNTWDLQPIQRYSLILTDINKQPVSNSSIKLIRDEVIIWEAKTDNKGEAELWGPISKDDASAEINYNGETYSIEKLSKYEDGINEFQLDKSAGENNEIDVVFTVDATGSMSDELEFLKTELNDVIDRIKSDNSSLEMRLASVFYRDEGDEYVTKPFAFTTEESELHDFINQQSASGGGDFPEAVHSALDIALNQLSWDEESKSRIMFLLLDAPPHYTQDAVASVEESLKKAAEKGIKIIPITASGIDKSTEFLMRAFGIITNGTYVFITDDSGVGNDHLEPTIGQFDVEKLNDLMVRIVNENIQ